MTQLHKPVCFIAMAFGIQDTDEFYEKQLLPVLKRCEIRPIIINRHQSNDDLNVQIFDQLRKADFCIVDLTYARQSVYFEAGYAQSREIPVVYTVRRDHLNKGQPDDRRVHFDVQMKPIITWDGLDDEDFGKRLEQRIRATFLTEWNKNKETNKKYEIAEEEFKKLPTLVRSGLIRKETIRILRKERYIDWDIYPYFYGHSNGVDQPKERIYSGLYNHSFGYKVNNRDLYLVLVHSFASPSKGELLHLQDRLNGRLSFTSNIQDLISKKKPKRLYITAFVLINNKISSSRIEDTMQTITQSRNGQHYIDFSVKRAHSFSGDFEPHLEYFFISNIKSILQLKDQLNFQINNMFSRLSDKTK